MSTDRGKDRDMDYSTPGSCRTCGAGTMVTTDPMTSKLVEWWTHDCRCLRGPEIEPLRVDAALLTARCQCGTPIHYHGKRCAECAAAHKIGLDRARDRKAELSRKGQRKCVDCGTPGIKPNAKRCTSCAAKIRVERSIEFHRGRVLTDDQAERKRATNREWARRNRKSRAKAA